jgi:hypothetical protein
MEPEVAVAGPVFGDGVFGLEGGKEMVSVGLGEIFDAEVINSEGEGGWFRGVAPEPRSLRDGVVAVLGLEVCNELLVG